MTTGPKNPYGQPPESAGPPPGPPPGPSPQSSPQPSPQPPYGPPYQDAYQQPGGYPPQPYGAGYPPPGYASFPQNEGLAVAAMVIGIVSMVLACGYGIGLLGSPVAMIMGRVSMKRIDASQGQLNGRGMAQAGFILGIIGTVLLVLALVALVVVIIVGVNGGFDDA